MASNPRGSKVLYVTSEESARQTALRAGRLGVKSNQLLVLAETNVERIVHQIAKHQPAVAVVDSIQMIYKPAVGGGAGVDHAVAGFVHGFGLSGEGERDGDYSCRARDEGGDAGGAEADRAYR